MLEEKDIAQDMHSNVEEVQVFSFYYKNVLDLSCIKRKQHMFTVFMSIKMVKHLDSEGDHFILIVEGTSFLINYGLGT